MSSVPFRYPWFAWGDLNAFFGLLLDNLTNLVLLWALLAGRGFPNDVYFQLMVPGTALGVLVGDIVYSWMAARLARRTKNPNVTAMPLGLDTPSTIGVALAVLIPSFEFAQKSGQNIHDAAITSWKVGMATMLMMGVVKTLAAFAGEKIQKIIPQAGLLGSLAGVGITLLGFLPLTHVYGLPVVGMVALGLLIYTLVAGHRLPGNIPGAFAAVAVGTILYYALGPTGLLGHETVTPEWSLNPALPVPTLGAFEELGTALSYLPFALPFGLLTIVGGINVTESARCAGDNYNTRNILLVEAGSTFIAGLFGGVVQTTPYIGHPAYKSMGARAAYTLACGLAVGLGAAFGLVGSLVEAIPAPAVAPTLIFVGLAITNQAFEVCNKKYYSAIVISLLPVIGELVRIALATVLFDPGVSGFPQSPEATRLFTTASILGHGFIITSMLSAAFVAELIDGRIFRSALYLLLMATLTLFGFIHSVRPQGEAYLPWTLSPTEAPAVWQLALAYSLTAMVFVMLKLTGRTHKGSPSKEAS